MLDRNGRPIVLGARAVMLRGDKSDPLHLDGKIGTVRAIKDRVGALYGKPGLRVTDGPDEDPAWSAWVKPECVAVVD